MIKEQASFLLAAAFGAALVLLAFFLLRRRMARKAERELAKSQEEMLQRHCEEVRAVYQTMRGWRHDFHNHIQAMKIYLSSGRLDELGTYLGSLDQDLSQVDWIVKTGNLTLDAILNGKLSLANSLGIPIHAKATVPEHLAVSDMDLCTVVGNLLDNALEACRSLPAQERFIRVYIRMIKRQLYLSVTNSSGKVRRLGKVFLSSKGEGHGFGLKSIDRVAQKYGGYVNRQAEDGVFATEVLLPMGVSSGTMGALPDAR